MRVYVALVLWTSMARIPLPVSAESTATVARIPRSTLYHTVAYSVSLLWFISWWNWFLSLFFLVYIVKDLVPDMTLFYKQYKSIQPWLQNDNPPEKGRFYTSFPLILLFWTSLRRRVPSITWRSSQARWHVRMHSMCLLFYVLSVLLVEPRWISGPCNVDADL